MKPGLLAALCATILVAASARAAAAPQETIYVVDGRNAIDVIDSSGGVIRRIVDPRAAFGLLHTDSAGDLYVARDHDDVSYDVAGYRAGEERAVRTIPVPANRLAAMALDANSNLYVLAVNSYEPRTPDGGFKGAQYDSFLMTVSAGSATASSVARDGLKIAALMAVNPAGTACVANDALAYPATGNTVVEYARGAARPSRTIFADAAAPQQVQQIALDGSGTLYVADFQRESRILVFPKGTSSPTLTFARGIYVTNLTIGPRDDLYVAHDSVVDVYARETATPYRTIRLDPSQRFTALTFDSTSNLYAIIAGPADRTSVQYYPSGSATGRTIARGTDFKSLAVWP